VWYIFYGIMGLYVFAKVVIPLTEYVRVQVVYMVSPSSSRNNSPPLSPTVGADGLLGGVSAFETEDEDDEVDSPAMRRMVEQQNAMAVAMGRVVEKLEKIEDSQKRKPDDEPAGAGSRADGDGGIPPSSQLDLDRLFDRMVEHERVVEKDSRRKEKESGSRGARREKAKKGKEREKEKADQLRDRRDRKKVAKEGSDDDAKDSEESESDGSGTDQEHESLERELKKLEEAAMNPREAMLRKLRKLRKVTWTMRGGRKARVAPKFLARLFAGGTTATEEVKRYISTKDMKGSAAADKMIQIAYLLDKMVKEDNDDLVNMESVEMMCRTLYGMQKAWHKVSERQDWERPKGLAAGTKWESKVAWELAKEYEIGPEEDDDMPEIDGADDEVSKRLQRRALLSKHLGTLTSATGK
jgi:hypothetical protein